MLRRGSRAQTGQKSPEKPRDDQAGEETEERAQENDRNDEIAGSTFPRADAIPVDASNGNESPRSPGYKML